MIEEATTALFNHLLLHGRVLCLNDVNFRKLFRRLRFRFKSLLLGRDMCEDY